MLEDHQLFNWHKATHSHFSSASNQEKGNIFKFFQYPPFAGIQDFPHMRRLYLTQFCPRLYAITAQLIFLLLILPTSFLVQASNEKTDVRIIIDISGSMKQTDPNNLRQPALKLLVELLPEGTTASVWTFGQYVNNLVPEGRVDAAWRARAKEAANTIGSVAMRTNLTGALDLAQKSMTTGNKDYTVILLTDGKIDMDESGGNPGTAANSRERVRLFEELMPRYAAAKAKVHTLALSDGADSVLLQQVAFESEGLFLESKTAEELLPTFLKAFDQAVPNEQVPIEGNKFAIDGSVEEFTALIFRRSSSQPTQIISPSGKAIGQKTASPNSNIRWHHDLNFDLVTIENPEEGEWSIRADLDPNNRVQILSDLKLAVDGMPSSLFAGGDISLDIALTNEDKVVTEPTILQLTDISYQLRLPDGQTVSQLLSDPEQLPSNGVFAETLSGLTQHGEYRLEVVASGRTFQRKRVFTASLAEPMSISTSADIENNIFDIRVSPQGDSIDTTLSRVLARIVAPDGSSVIDTLAFDNDVKDWHLPLEAKKGPGRYEVVLNIRGVSKSGKTFKSDPANISIEFPLKEQGPFDDAPSSTALPSISSLENKQEDTNIEEPEPTSSVEPEVVPIEETPQESPKDEPEEQQPDQQEEVKEPVTDEDAAEADEDAAEESIPWWVYVALAVVNLLIMAGAAFWWLSRRKSKKSSDDDNIPATASESLGGDADIVVDDFGDDADIASKPTENKDTASMGGGGDMDINVDVGNDNSAADPAADAWGEFDEDIAATESSDQADTNESPLGDDDPSK